MSTMALTIGVSILALTSRGSIANCRAGAGKGEIIYYSTIVYTTFTNHSSCLILLLFVSPFTNSPVFGRTTLFCGRFLDKICVKNTIITQHVELTCETD